MPTSDPEVAERHEVDVQPYKVAILGATGLVGQRLLERLIRHPWFEVVALAASDRSAGKTYGESVRWVLSSDPPPSAASLRVRRCRADELDDCDLVLSALAAAVAREVEPECVRAGIAVVSNSGAMRMTPDVPLLVPEVNASHLAVLEAQKARTSGGYVVTNPNCSVTGLVLALAPLHEAFGVRRIVVSTMQALSGAGLHGPLGLDTLENVVPWIPGEEEKMEVEVGKILGSVDQGRIREADLILSAHCHRVPVLDGHLEAVSVELGERATPAQASAVMREFRGGVSDLVLPSAPAQPVIVRHEPDRPQPRLDRYAGGGMSAVVGRLRPCPVLTLRFEVLSHNTIRGAAGGAILNAELLAAKDLLPRRAPR